jgi:hypothetical protein
MGANNADFRGEPSHMTANEIVAKYQPSDLGHRDYLPWEEYQGDHIEETVPEHWERKYQESTEPGFWGDGTFAGLKKQPPLVDLIKKNGYDQSKPVELHRNGYISHGHHRIAVMLKHAPNELIPVTHVGTRKE